MTSLSDCRASTKTLTRSAFQGFKPLPFLGNGHVQTLLGNLLHWPLVSLVSRQHQVLLDDGDQLVLHESLPPAWCPGGPIVLLVHGLGGTHASGYMKRLTGLLLARDMRVVRMDLRGCGKGLALARKPYHAGCSGDVRAAAAAIHRWSPKSSLSMIGLSLGGNIVLKLAGEAPDYPVAGLERVATIAPPIDLERSAELLALPRNRFYELHFLKELLAIARRRQRLFPASPEVRYPRRLTLRLFDELYTAPRCGFAGAMDYYRRSASLPVMPRIQVPALILTARDDPFIPVEPFEDLTLPSQVEVHISPRGGHLGFLGWDGAGGIRWAERRVVEWLAAGLK